MAQLLRLNGLLPGSYPAKRVGEQRHFNISFFVTGLTHVHSIHTGIPSPAVPTECSQIKLLRERYIILLFWLPGIFDKFILFSSSGNVTFI